MTNMLIQTLNKIEKSLEKLGHSCLNYLNIGLSVNDIEKNFSKIFLKPSDELVDLFVWKNGTRIDEKIKLGNLSLFPGFYFMSLEECIRNYSEKKELQNWKETWFPVFTNGGGDFYVVDLDEKANGAVIGFFIYEDDPTIEYNSLTLMMQTFAKCYSSGIIFRDDNGYLDMDYTEHAIIAHRLNPNLKIWNDVINSI